MEGQMAFILFTREIGTDCSDITWTLDIEVVKDKEEAIARAEARIDEGPSFLKCVFVKTESLSIGVDDDNRLQTFTDDDDFEVIYDQDALDDNMWVREDPN
jgi:hypothetical protein